jgi:NTP pyrophosphatase (non-canonical NTP hydrolase)
MVEQEEQKIQLTPRINEYMGIMQEECAEVIQIISKINRFGLYSFNPFEVAPRTNRQLLADEVGDIYAMILKLEEKGLFTRNELEERAAYKHEKLKTYLRTSE